MKRSKTIKLLLLSAGVASCNHGGQPTTGYDRDWVYVTKYPYPYLSLNSDSSGLYHQTLPSIYFDNWFYLGHPARYTQASVTKKGSVVRSARFVVRGGFGGHGFASS